MSQSEIILIRHGQANTGAKDEESYDKLSATGHQQSAWLGDYLRAQDTAFDRVICGDLRRHQETAAGLALSQSIAIDPRVNELRYFDLAREYQAQTRQPLPSSAEEFAQHVPELFTAWHAGRLDGAHENIRQLVSKEGAGCSKQCSPFFQDRFLEDESCYVECNQASCAYCDGWCL